MSTTQSFLSSIKQSYKEGKNPVGKVGWATLNIFASIILAAIAFIYCSEYLPGVINTMYSIFSDIRGLITEDSRGIPINYDTYTKFLLSGETLIFTSFIIVIHLCLASLTALIQSLFNTK